MKKQAALVPCVFPTPARPVRVRRWPGRQPLSCVFTNSVPACACRRKSLFHLTALLASLLCTSATLVSAQNWSDTHSYGDWEALTGRARKVLSSAKPTPLAKLT